MGQTENVWICFMGYMVRHLKDHKAEEETNEKIDIFNTYMSSKG